MKKKPTKAPTKPPIQTPVLGKQPTNVADIEVVPENNPQKVSISVVELPSQKTSISVNELMASIQQQIKQPPEPAYKKFFK